MRPALAALTVLCASTCAGAAPAHSLSAPCPIVVAHRGSGEGSATENQLASIGYAANHRADWLEFDVRVTSDGVPVILHDATLDRTTDGSGYVNLQPWSVVQAYDVPSLWQWLRTASATRMTLLLELKPMPAVAVQRTIRAVRLVGLEGRTIVHSFSENELRTAHVANPALRLVRIDAKARPLPTDLPLWGVNLRYDLYPAEAAGLRKAGLQVGAWTPDGAAEWQPVMGAQFIVTNEPYYLDRYEGC